jgi:hypothetical protein
MRKKRNVVKLGSIWIGAVILLAGALLSCSDGGGDGGSGSRSSFWVLDFTKDYLHDPSAWYKIEVTKKAETARAVVYVDKNETQVTEGIAGLLAQEFENSIYSEVTQHFALPYDVDGSGKTILVVLDISDGYHPVTNPSYVGGYFFSVDLFSEGSIDAYNTLYGMVLKTNEGDIVYIDSNPQDTNSEDAWRTIAHEFQHLVNASYSITKGEDYQDTWIDEGLAEAANHICYGEVTDRIDYYNSYNYTGSPVTNGHPLFYWDTSSHLVNYSLSYLFFQYLRSQSYLKNGIFKEIIESVHGNDEAVKDAMDADSNLSDTAKWGSTRDERFNRLLLRWYATNQNISTMTNNLYAYDGEITTIPDAILYNSNNVSLMSGGGVVKDMSSVFNSPVSGFIYMSLQSDGMVEDFISSYDLLDYFVAVYRNYLTGSHSAVNTPLPISTIIGDDSRDQSVRASSSVMRMPQKIDFILPPDIGERLRGLK